MVVAYFMSCEKSCKPGRNFKFPLRFSTATSDANAFENASIALRAIIFAMNLNTEENGAVTSSTIANGALTRRFADAFSTAQILAQAQRVLQIESDAVAQLSTRLRDESSGNEFVSAVQLVLDCRGRVVVTGIGKSGAIGRKIAATFASTGTPALFLHAAEGLHGDLGMVAPGDVLIALSYTGRTADLTSILPVVRDMGVPIIAITGKRDSILAAVANCVLNVAVEREACPLNLAPTASTTASLAMGDALAVCVMTARRFSHDDFARFHPGGALGQASKLRVGELMRTGERLAIVPDSATMRQTLQAITAAGSGAVAVVGADRVLVGYLTDGDVRRQLLHCDNAETLLDTNVQSAMTPTPLAFSPQMMAIEALRALQERGVDDAPVVDENNRPLGLLDVQELLRAGLV